MLINAYYCLRRGILMSIVRSQRLYLASFRAGSGSNIQGSQIYYDLQRQAESVVHYPSRVRCPDANRWTLSPPS